MNAVDDMENASAYLGGIVQKSGVTIAISTDGEAPALAGLLREAVKHARDYIEEHFREPISLRRLADLTGASTFHLLRSFKQEVGLPPAAYQIHLKVAEAKRLLRSGAPIADAAAELGFVDQSHLTRHFCKIVGTTPGRYAAQ